MAGKAEHAQPPAVVKDGKIIEYHVNVKVAFVVEGPEIGTP